MIAGDILPLPSTTGPETPRQGGVAEQLSFALYGAANRVVRLHKPFLDPLGITFPQFLVILELLNGSPRTVGELCTRLDMDTGTLTPVLKRLQAAGRVTRTRDVNDERRVLVDLTEASRTMASEIHAVTGKIRSACQLTEADVYDLRLTLEALAHPASE
ncbi:MarR family transcriptional regulator [Stenotrophomonas rhizophila]|uniref:MarR family transcriptional regulator n=1 Tax=Stenotrophomonas rhizophila TaxID=216778 RepID=A0A498CE80_9GAMM|nr:MarR family winged helix-turn-helix transcriptional regulator [Stenotrophomonas rhizophila]RLK56388.1 MarR family transcriptional regulator [Stenotrophomonas rhizophila]